MKWKTCEFFVERKHQWDVAGRCSWILDKKKVDEINALCPPVYYIREVPTSKAIAHFDCEICKCYKEKENE